MKGEWLDWMILWVFSNLSDSMILYREVRKRNIRVIFFVLIE